jgi:predicted ABC-type ATPase
VNTKPKTIYVVGGTNGVGKSTIREELLGSAIPYINADFIAKELKA